MAFYAPDDKIEQRIELLGSFAQELIDNGAIPSDRVLLQLGRIPLVVKGHFLLNKFYKFWRINTGHLTEPPKIAAVQSLAIMTFLPFIPLYPDDVRDVGDAFPNEIFSFAYALGIMKVQLPYEDNSNKDFWLRMIDILREAREVAPSFYPVATRVWRFSSFVVGATGQGAEPLRSAAPWAVAVKRAA